jgi:biotin transporter BioY
MTGRTRKPTVRLAGALALSDFLILAVGASWLHAFSRVAYSQAWVLGFYAFVIGDILKLALVGFSLPEAVDGRL